MSFFVDELRILPFLCPCRVSNTAQFFEQYFIQYHIIGPVRCAFFFRIIAVMKAVEGIAFWIIARLWLKYNFEPQSAQNRRPEYLLVHQCLSRRCRPLWTAAEKQCTPPAYFRTTADFCGIRRNSSKTKVSFFRTFSFTAEKKKGGHAPYFAFVCSVWYGVFVRSMLP